MGKLQSLQVLRFLAALAVVEAHASATFVRPDANQTGAIGVDVFFVISGVVITLTARRHPEGFLRNRAVRVLPPYYVWVLPWLLPALAAHTLPLRMLAASLTLWPIWGDYTQPALQPAWSLYFEMLFYVAFWASLRGVKPVLLIGGYALCAGLAIALGWPLFRYLGAPIIVEFLAGVVIALSFRQARPRLGLALVALAVAAISLFAILGTAGLEMHHLYSSPLSWLRPLAWGVPAALLVLGALHAEPLLGGAWLKPLVFLGDASYSLYLTHLLVLAVIAGLWPRAPAIGCIAVCVGAGALAYACVERPLLRLLRRLASRHVVVGRTTLSTAEGR